MTYGMGTKAKVHEVMAVVCAGEGITIAEMKSAARFKRLSIPRQYAMYLSRELTGQSYPQIGRLFGNRDHTTALFGYRKIAALVQCSPPLAEKLAAYRKQIIADATARILASGHSSPWHPKPGFSMLRPTSVTVEFGLAA